MRFDISLKKRYKTCDISQK